MPSLPIRFTTRPPACFFMIGSTYFRQRTYPMNLSCSPFCQSSSVSVSMTPPGADPALLTKISMRPKCLCAPSTKSLAPASRVRSATMANTLRPPPPRSPAAARAADLLGSPLEHVLATRADRDIAAFAGERHGDSLADAFAAAGDAGDLALQLQVHCDLLLSWPMLYCENYTAPRA